MIPTPNPEALEYLEADLDRDCTVYKIRPMRNDSELDVIIHLGFLDGMAENFQRPMFEVINDGTRWGGPLVDTPCLPCFDFSRSWNCPDHHEPMNLESALALSAEEEE